MIVVLCLIAACHLAQPTCEKKPSRSFFDKNYMGVHFKLILGNSSERIYDYIFFLTSDFIFGYKGRKDFAGKKVFQARI